MRLLTLLLLFVAQASWASGQEVLQAPVITKVQGSVFVSHEGKYYQAKEGMKLTKGDVVRTFTGGKTYIDFPDQSRIKLGVKSHFVVHDFGRVCKRIIHSFYYWKEKLRWLPNRASMWNMPKQVMQ